MVIEKWIMLLLCMDAAMKGEVDCLQALLTANNSINTPPANDNVWYVCLLAYLLFLEVGDSEKTQFDSIYRGALLRPLT